MLLQITNNCNEGCSHCMQDSKPKQFGEFNMDAEIFDASIVFSNKLLHTRNGINRMTK